MITRIPYHVNWSDMWSGMHVLRQEKLTWLPPAQRIMTEMPKESAQNECSDQQTKKFCILNVISYHIQGLVDFSSGTAKRSRRPSLLRSRRYIELHLKILVWASSRYIHMRNTSCGKQASIWLQRNRYASESLRRNRSSSFLSCVNFSIAISDVVVHYLIWALRNVELSCCVC